MEGMMSEFKFSKPSAMIQIELPDGRLIEGPRGSTLEDFLNILKPELKSELVGAVVNGELKELRHQLNSSANVTPFTMEHSGGLIIYKRSLVYMMAACFEKLFPDFDLEVKHSIKGGGIFCCVYGPRDFTAKDRQKLQKEMRRLVAADHKINKIIIKGFPARSTGNPYLNRKYARRRAEHIKQQLVKKYGIESYLIDCTAYGEPNVKNDLDRVVTIYIREAK